MFTRAVMQNFPDLSNNELYHIVAIIRIIYHALRAAFISKLASASLYFSHFRVSVSVLPSTPCMP